VLRQQPPLKSLRRELELVDLANRRVVRRRDRLQVELRDSASGRRTGSLRRCLCDGRLVLVARERGTGREQDREDRESTRVWSMS